LSMGLVALIVLMLPISWDQNGSRYTLGLKASKKETLVEMANELGENGLRELVEPMREIPIR